MSPPRRSRRRKRSVAFSGVGSRLSGGCSRSARCVKGVKIQIYSSGCGSVVLMQETAEVVAALDGTAGRWVQLRRFGWPERESTMRALGVVVLNVGPHDR